MKGEKNEKYQRNKLDLKNKGAIIPRKKLATKGIIKELQKGKFRTTIIILPLLGTSG